MGLRQDILCMNQRLLLPMIQLTKSLLSPYEIEYPGGANEHYNTESGRTWLERAITKWPNYLWINPTTKEHWEYTHSTHIIKEIFEDRMVPLTLNGLKEGMRHLS